ncbi:hypothetical protein [Dysgonomonas mossii]|uniref:hypothetical protein n=1 Tax=Dysgonomonas mossii TaxID=163665 RepID=UPI0026EA299D|nr:hypothetical protein [Dysgonomonas mossii]MBS5908149.1 hypothetical protein [Dysgonomonas mossii]
MSNCIEKNPTKSLVIYTIAVIGAVWAILTFVLDDNKESLHKKQIDNLNTIIDIKEEKIKHLERENSILINTNQKYIEWLQSSPQSIHFFTNKIKELENVIQKDTIIIEKTSVKQEKHTKFFTENTIREGHAFIDKKTGAVIGINYIKTDKTAEGILNLPNQKEKQINNFIAGNKWSFTFENVEYELFIKEINYIGSSYKIIMQEK